MEDEKMVIGESVYFGYDFKKSIRHQEEMSRRPLGMSLEFGGEIRLRIQHWKSSPSRWYLVSQDNSEYRWRECRWVLALVNVEVWKM